MRISGARRIAATWLCVGLGLAVLCGPSRAAAQATAEDQAALDAYYDCARAAARRLEPSGEAAEAIGRATRVLCQKESSGAVQAWLRMNPAKAAENIERTVAWGDTVAMAEVISIRLCRQAKDCRTF